MRIRLSLPSPYVGLRPFFEREALLFFGRDAHVRDLLARLKQRERFLAVLGASGTGKSSLVRAGLIPALRRGALATEGGSGAPEPASPIDRWNTCIFTPGDAPLARLAQALNEDERWRDGESRETAEGLLAARLGASPLALSTLYRQRAGRFPREALLLVVDQFEEIFRYHQRDPDEADSFVKLLLRSASEDVPIYVVITMRSDFLGQAVAVHGLAEAINGGIYLTPRLHSEQILSVITSPLALVGGSIDPVLANRLVNTLGGEDELPVLEHALLRMWDRAKSMGRSSLDHEDYVAICGARDGSGGAPALPLAIDNHASEIHDALTPAQQLVARQVFLALVERREGRDVRRPQTLRALRALVGESSAEDLRAVLDAYRAPGVGFVLPAAGRPLGDDDLVDISHESLIRRWRSLQTWLADESRDVTELREWKQRAERRLDGGGWLDENDARRAAGWRARVLERGDPVPWAERHAGPGSYAQVDRYLLDSQAELNRVRAQQEALRNEAEQAQVRGLELEARLQREAAERAAREAEQAQAAARQARAAERALRKRGRIVAFVCVLALVAGGVAGYSYRESQRLLVESEATSRRAQAGELARAAETVGNDQPDTSVLLALEAHRLDPTSTLANALIRAAAAQYPYRLVLRDPEGVISSAALSLDDKTVLTTGLDGKARLWDLAQPRAPRVLAGSELPVERGAISPDGTLAATAGVEGSIHLWRVADARLHAQVAGHEQAITSISFSLNGELLLSTSVDGTARLWRTADGAAVLTLAGHEGPVLDGQFSPDGQSVITAGQDQTARLWNVADGRTLQVLQGHTYAVNVARFSPDGRLMLTGSGDYSAMLWQRGRSQPLQVLLGHTRPVVGVQFSPNGKLMLTTSLDDSARIWSVADGAELQVLRGHDGRMTSAVFSPGSTRVLTAGSDRTVRLWDAESGDELRVLRGHEGTVSSAGFAADGRTILSVGDDGTARLWPVAASAGRITLEGHKEAVASAVFSADGRRVLTAGNDGTARLVDVYAPGRPAIALQGHAGPLAGASFSPDGLMLLTYGIDGTARLWDAAGGAARQVLRGTGDPVTAARFSADGKTVVVSADNGSVRLYSTAEGRELQLFLVPEGAAVSSAELSADGRTLLTASWDGQARTWSADGRLLKEFQGHRDGVTSAHFSADGTRIVTASWDKTARLWDAAGGKAGPVLRGHSDQVNGAIFSPGKTGLVLTFSDDRTARLWTASGGKYLRTLSGHEGPITDAQFSPDGSAVLTASRDNTARLWDVASGKELRTWRNHTQGVTSARFSPDGKTVVTAGEDGLVRVLKCLECEPLEGLAAAAAERVGRTLSADELDRHVSSGPAQAKSARE